MGKHSNKCMHWIPLNAGRGNWHCDCGVSDVEFAMEDMDFWHTLDNKPDWMDETYHPSYMTYMGSHAYGCATPESDVDFYGFIVPPVGIAFPFTLGDIRNFGNPSPNFKQLQKHHMMDAEYGEVDLQLYSLAYYFDLLMDGNPNLMDSIFTPEDVVVALDAVGKMVRDSRDLFVSALAWRGFLGIAGSHRKKVESRTREGSRKLLVDKWGYDTKDASHVVRTLLQAEELLLTGDMDMYKNSDVVLSIKNGEWEKEDVFSFFEEKKDKLNKAQDDGKFEVPDEPDYEAIKQLLVDCYEEKFGSLSKLRWNIF